MKKVVKLINEHRTAVAVSIIACILYDLLKNFFQFILDSGYVAYDSLVDFIFYYMSTVNEYTLISFIYSLAFGIVMGVFVAIIVLENFLHTEAGKCFKDKYSKMNSRLIRKYTSITLCVVFFFIQFLNVYCCGKRNDFNRDMILIKPYIEYGEYDKLNSDWNQMHCKKDYKKIISKISKIKEKNHLG